MIRKSIRQNKMKKRKKVNKALALLIASSLALGGTNVASLGATGITSDGVNEFMTYWVSLSQSDRDEQWELLSDDQREIVLSQVSDDGTVHAGDYGVNTMAATDSHSDSKPSWCTCVEDTGVRSIVLNDESYEKNFVNQLAPKGEPVSEVSNDSYKLPVGNGETKTWNRSDGHLMYYGEYNGKDVLNRILETKHKNGYELRDENTQTLGVEAIMLEANETLYRSMWAPGVVNASDSYADWTDTTIYKNINGSAYYNTAYDEIEKEQIVDTTTNAIKEYGMALSANSVAIEGSVSFYDVAASGKVWLLSVRETLGYYATIQDRTRDSIGSINSNGQTDLGLTALRSTSLRNTDNYKYVGWLLDNSRNLNIYAGSHGMLGSAQPASANLFTLSPAINLTLSSLAFTSVSNKAKSDFGATIESSFTGSGTSATASRTWDVTLLAGQNFSADTDMGGNVKPGQSLYVENINTGTKLSGFESVAYDRLSAVVIDEDGMVAMYGKVGEIDDTYVTISIPEGVLDAGTYEVKLFAEQVNSVNASGTLTHETDYASNMVKVATVVVDTLTFDIDYNEDKIELVEYPDGYDDISYTDLAVNTAIGGNVEVEEEVKLEAYIFEAKEGYYFQDSYSAFGTCNGITVKALDGEGRQIAVYGVLQDDVGVVLPTPSLQDYTVTFEKLSTGNSYVTHDSFTYNMATSANSYQVPEGPEVTNETFLYWALEGKEGEDKRVYAGDFYDQVIGWEVYRPVYGPMMSGVYIDINLDTDPRNYTYEEHGYTIALYEQGATVTGVPPYSSTVDSYRVRDDGYQIYIGDVENGTYDIYFVDVDGTSFDTGKNLIMNASSAKDITEYDMYFYTVTWNYNDKSVTASVTQRVFEGQLATPPADPTYKTPFLGWAIDDGTDVRDIITGIANTKITDTTKFEAQYGVPSYNVTFRTEDGDIVAGIDGPYTSGTLLKVPTADQLPVGSIPSGESFSGWREVNGSTVLDPSTEVDEYYEVNKEIIFEPIFSENMTTITFVVKVDDVLEEIHNKRISLYNKVSGDSTDTADADDILTGVLDGEYVVEINGVPTSMPVSVSASTVTGNEMTVELNFYTVTYDFDNGANVSTTSQTVLYGEDTIVPVGTPSKKGFEFAGWDNEGENITGVRTIKALYSAMNFTVRFEDGSGNLVDPDMETTYACGEQVDAPSVTGALGQSVDYWVDKSDASNRIQWPYKYTVEAQDVTFIPVFKDTTANVKVPIWLDGITWTGHNKTFLVKGSDNIYYGSYTSEGLISGVPLGEYRIYETTGGAYVDTGVDVIVEGIADATPVLPIQYFTVSYWNDVEGQATGLFTEEQIVLSGKYANTPETHPVKDGHTFVGWTPNKTIITTTTDYYPEYTGETVLITFRTSLDTLISTNLREIGATLTRPEPPEIEHYEFIGWDKVVPTNVPDVDTVYTANYQEDEDNPPPQASENEVYITFWDYNGTTIQASYQSVGATMYKPNDPTRSGYTFIGWGPEVPSVVPDSSATYVAQYEEDNDGTQVYITFLDYNGDTLQSGYQEIGDSMTKPDEPSRSGYTFTGWSPSVPSTVPSSNGTYIAQYTKDGEVVDPDVDPDPEEDKSYVSFLDYDGKVIQIGYQVVGAVMSKPSNPTRSGYTFTGWNPSVPSVVPSGNATYVAQYTKDDEIVDPDPVPTPDPEEDKSYISFLDYDGSIIQVGYQVVGAIMSKPSNPTRSGYTFTGWSPSVPGMVPSGNTTYIAQYEAISSGGSGGGGSTTVPTQPNITYPTIPDEDDDEDEEVDEEENTEDPTLGFEILPDEDIPTSATPGGSDINNNGIPDYLEDLDGDGIFDGTLDLNGNGIPDYLEDLNGNGIPDGQEDLNGNGIPDYLEDWWEGDGKCHEHLDRFLVMLIFLSLELLWLEDRRRRQEKEYKKIRRDMEEERVLMHADDIVNNL